jgi:hypothetical protein
MAQVSVQPFYSGRAYYDVTSADGQKYVFVPQEFVEKGFVQDGQQFYDPGFLTPGALSTASAFTLPSDSSLTSAAKSIYKNPTKGFVWKADDFKNINPNDFTFQSYQPYDKYGTIKGLTIKDGVPYYAQEPSSGADYALLGKDGIATNFTVTRSSSGGGGFLGSLLRGDVGGALSMLDPSAAISRATTDLFSPVAQAATDLFQPVEKAITAGVADVSKVLSTDDAKKAMAVGAAFFVPGVGAAIGQSLVTAGVITGAAIPYAAAIGTALASTAAQTAQGVPLDQALGNSVTSAVVSTGAPSVAQDINALVKSPAVADAITSAGASALKTAIAGGSAEDIQRNMTAALAGSSASSLYSQAAEAETAATGRVIGAAVGGGIAGGTMGAVTGVAGELGRPETTPTRPPQLAEADTGTVSDVPTLTEVLVTATPEAPDIGDTSIISPDTSISPGDRAVIDAAGITEAPSLPQVTVTATPESPAIEDTSIITPDTSISPQDKAIINTTGIGDEPSLKEVTVTARPEAPEIEDTSIIDPVSVTDEPAEKDVVAEEEPAEEEPAEEEPVDKEEPYKPELFVYGGKTPKPRTRTRTDLGTTLQGPFAPSTTLGQALTGYRGAGEIEGKKTGKPRREVWNEESLRLKDALGL